MVSVYSKNLQVYNAEQFKTSVDKVDQPYLYFTFGKVNPWTDENNPPQANTSVDSFNEVWKNMIGAKQIQGNDVRLGIRRYDWAPGQSYYAYDDCACSMNMNNPDHNFYVITDDWNVYKCIANNNGNLSTAKPIGTDFEFTEQTSDKYIWKYMYTLSDEEKLRFTTSEYIPVKTLTEDDGSLQWQVQRHAKQGSIQAIKILNRGINYNTTPTITITGDGTGANAFATVNSAASNCIESIIISSPGASYTYADVVITPTSDGSGASARVIMSPPGGHGSNPKEELGGSYVIINPRLRGNELNVLDTRNEFRQVSILKNPVILGSNTLASDLVYSQVTTIIVDSVGGNYQEDEFVYQGRDLASASFKGRVVSWTTNEEINMLKLIDVAGTPTSGPISGDISKTSRLYQSTITKAFEPYTGSLLYLNNIPPIQRADDQTEDFKIVFSF